MLRTKIIQEILFNSDHPFSTPSYSKVFKQKLFFISLYLIRSSEKQFQALNRGAHFRETTFRKIFQFKGKSNCFHLFREISTTDTCSAILLEYKYLRTNQITGYHLLTIFSPAPLCSIFSEKKYERKLEKSHLGGSHRIQSRSSNLRFV